MSRRKHMAQREPNGRAQREPQAPAASEVRRLRDAALSGMRDPLWGTEIGRLYLASKITSTMFAAGKRWAELATQYSQALCSPAPDPKAISLERTGAQYIDPDSAEGRREARRHARAVQSFLDAHAALMTDAGPAAERAVRTTCERGEMITGHADLIALSTGLSRLAEFWGLDKSAPANVR